MKEIKDLTIEAFHQLYDLNLDRDNVAVYTQGNYTDTDMYYDTAYGELTWLVACLTPDGEYYEFILLYNHTTHELSGRCLDARGYLMKADEPVSVFLNEEPEILEAKERVKSLFIKMVHDYTDRDISGMEIVVRNIGKNGEKLWEITCSNQSGDQFKYVVFEENNIFKAEYRSYMYETNRYRIDELDEMEMSINAEQSS